MYYGCKGDTICLFCSLYDDRRTACVTAVVHIVLRASYARMTAVVYLSFACKQNGFLL